MKPLYNSNSGRVSRPRKQVKRLGYMPRELKTDVLKYGISKLDVGLTLIALGVDVLNLGR